MDDPTLPRSLLGACVRGMCCSDAGMAAWRELALPQGDSLWEGRPREWSELVALSVLSPSLCPLPTWPRGISLNTTSSSECLVQAPEQSLLSHLFHSRHASHICGPPSGPLHGPLSPPGTHTGSSLANLTSCSKTVQVSHLRGSVSSPLRAPNTLFESLTRGTDHTVLVSWPSLKVY